MDSCCLVFSFIKMLLSFYLFLSCRFQFEVQFECYIGIYGLYVDVIQLIVYGPHHALSNCYRVSHRLKSMSSNCLNKYPVIFFDFDGADGLLLRRKGKIIKGKFKLFFALSQPTFIVYYKMQTKL